MVCGCIVIQSCESPQFSDGLALLRPGRADRPNRTNLDRSLGVNTASPALCQRRRLFDLASHTTPDALRLVVARPSRPNSTPIARICATRGADTRLGNRRQPSYIAAVRALRAVPQAGLLTAMLFADRRQFQGRWRIDCAPSSGLAANLTAPESDCACKHRHGFNIPPKCATAGDDCSVAPYASGVRAHR